MACCKVKITVNPQETIKVSSGREEAVQVKVGKCVAVYNDAPVYRGEHVVIPLADAQTVLETAEKLLLENITVTKIPYYETSNSAGGDTVYIGSEVMINGEQ